MKKDLFINRHIGPTEEDVQKMLKTVGASSLEELMNEIIPQNIQLEKPVFEDEPFTEAEMYAHMEELGAKNKCFKNYIGQGYYETVTPAPIIRNVLEDPTWYTSYTPYQAEISQGRLEALLNFQTMLMDLTAMPLANCSLLDESSAAHEAIYMMYSARTAKMKKAGVNKIFVDECVFPQTLDLIKTRATALDFDLRIGDYKTAELDESFFGAVVQYPNANGTVVDYREFSKSLEEKGIKLTVIADVMSLVLLTPPGEWGADIVCGSTQRFGIPLGYGGPHAGFITCKEEYKRTIPGRIIGVTKNAEGKKALRMALQTREQHIKRERATSNICTAQALLATMASFYVVYHGKEGLKRIATNIHSNAYATAKALGAMGLEVHAEDVFDTIRINLTRAEQIKVKEEALAQKINFNYPFEGVITISFGENTNTKQVEKLVAVFARALGKSAPEIEVDEEVNLPKSLLRSSDFLTAEVFNKYRSETGFMRYIKQLERKDLGLNTAMIPLGSCTMKLNSATSMFPLSWSEFNSIHPFAPDEQTKGYEEMIAELKDMLCKITGFAGISIQPNSGATGEHTGLLVIRQYHNDRGQAERKKVLIPRSAHGTNPASAVVVGYEPVIVKSDENGNIDVEDLKVQAEKHKDNLAAAMITYPSTHGVYEHRIREIIDIVHEHGGQVYMDGANMNAQCNLTNPGFIGADVCHLNLHKTFAIPHGGGGPGVGPIGVAKHLVPFLPNHVMKNVGGEKGIGAVAAAPYGSASVNTITYAYLKMLGGEGLTYATQVAILSANYIAKKLEENNMKVLYKGNNGRVAHELIFDCNEFNKEAGITDSDIAKRLMDYGFHAPTLSFPVHGTLMIEPTESEPLSELDRFIEALVCIKKEIEEVNNGDYPADDNVLKNAPHTQTMLLADEWTHAYTRTKAAYPVDYLRENKFWPATSRVDDGYGDRNLMCSCVGLENYEE
ncbi:glycine dehydrogenase (decarboxylating) [Balneicella halophila]|uniref:glycine dehydrogenase (aminomethyl-transferring) n=1 Tax=Balneicella halophila TaxID=1537566 RepID=A0A7L4UQW9_BALHA|nr:aminomethyl-transferring glycine dehydrogenase [Balneicella halophila]PVX51002.1 glycine dehydrogenase (decarboxylating) [Balneicella halophila]